MEDPLFISLRRIMHPSSMKSCMPQFEDRPEQLQMAEEVLKAFSDESIALIEAGTGTGKSLAYLLPALLFAAKTGEQVIVSTNTITLQEQLLYKDIPLALKLLNCSLNVVLAKGMGNYVCLEKLSRCKQGASLHRQKSQEEQQLFSWCQTTATGSRSDIPFRIGNECWESISADIDTCSTCRCQNTSSCFFLTARRALKEAHLILTNHHLLFADIVRRVETGNRDEMCLLPPPKRLILDEGHHIEDVATAFFSHKSSRLEFDRALSTFATDATDNRWLKIRSLFSKTTTKEGSVDYLEKLFSQEKQTRIALDELFHTIDLFSDQLFSTSTSESDGLQKIRLTDALTMHKTCQ